uniref:Uncharacterized protein n=1 Tax=Romanomermis culicivorax TaxID=13658 RepID=A0A915I5I1_ROMCU
MASIQLYHGPKSREQQNSALCCGKTFFTMENSIDAVTSHKKWRLSTLVCSHMCQCQLHFPICALANCADFQCPIRIMVRINNVHLQMAHFIHSYSSCESLITDKALDTKAVSDNDRDRSKMPGGDLDDDSDKSVARDRSAISNRSFSSTRKCPRSSSHGSSVIEDTLWDDAPASNDSQVVMPEFIDDPLIKCQHLSLQPKTKLIANWELLTCFEETKTLKEHYTQMAILDYNVAIAPTIDDDLCHFLEWANKWPALLECAFPLIAILKEIEQDNGDLSYVQKAVGHSLCHFSLVLHDLTVNRPSEMLHILGINTKILPEISSVNVASDENIQRCLDLWTKIAPPPLFGHLLCSKLKERGHYSSWGRLAIGHWMMSFFSFSHAAVPFSCRKTGILPDQE